MQIVELIAELREPEPARRQCVVLGASRVGWLRLTETHCRVVRGAVTRRAAPGEPTEWIVAERPTGVGPRVVELARLTDEQARRRWGERGLPSWVTVRLTRELWWLEEVRIQLDEVDGLGAFVAIEAPVTARQPVAAALAAVRRLRATLAPTLGEPIGATYGELAAGSAST